MTRSLSTLLAAAALLVVLPETVAACPVCFSATEENRLAFLGTTVFLSLLPLGMVAGAGLWIRRRSKERDEQDDGPAGQRRSEP